MSVRRFVVVVFTGGIYPGVLSLKSAITAYRRRGPHHTFGKATGGIMSYANSGEVIVLSCVVGPNYFNSMETLLMAVSGLLSVHTSVPF